MNFRRSTHIKAFFIFCSVALICTNLSGQHLSANVSEEDVQIREGRKNVLFYQTRPKSMAGKYARAGYIHPLYDLNGEVLTEDFPEDHPYHHGIFWAWHQIVFNNNKIADRWISENISWDPVLKRIKESKNSITVRLSAFPKSGVAVFCPPEGHAGSQQWILRREKSMQNVVYPGRKPVVLPLKGLRLKYRIVIHNDKIGNRDLKKLYQQFVDHSE